MTLSEVGELQTCVMKRRAKSKKVLTTYKHKCTDLRSMYLKLTPPAKPSLAKPHPQGRLATQVKSPMAIKVLTHAVSKFDFMMFKIVQ